MKKNINELNLYGFEEGKVDSGKAVRGGSGGNWGGSMERALEIASFAKACGGKNPSSQKRSRVKTRSGNVSDHYENNDSAYAVDLPASGSKGDELLACIMKKFNDGKQAGYKGGKWLNVNVNGYRYQFGWRVPDHYDHIHVGVKRGGGGTNDEIPLDKNDEVKKDDTELTKTDNLTNTDATKKPDETEKSVNPGLLDTLLGLAGLKEEVQRIKKLMK